MVLTCSSSLKTIQLLAWVTNLSAPTGSETCLTEVWSSVSVQGHLCSGNTSVTLDQTCENRYVLRKSCARNTCKRQCWGGEGAVGVPLLLGSGGAFQLTSVCHHFTGTLLLSPLSLPSLDTTLLKLRCRPAIIFYPITLAGSGSTSTEK